MPNKLIQAIFDDDFEKALVLIEENKDNIIDNPDEEGAYPIHLVTDFSLYDSLDDDTKAQLNRLAISLINKGSNINLEFQGMLPIHYAAYHGNLEVFIALVNMGANHAAQDVSGSLSLHYAIKNKHDPITDYILSNFEFTFAKTNPDLDGQSYTPLDYAREYNPDYVPKLMGKLKSTPGSTMIQYNLERERRIKEIAGREAATPTDEKSVTPSVLK